MNEFSESNMNNLGDLFEEQVTASKEGKKIEALKNSLTECEIILKTLAESDPVIITKGKIVPMLRILYTKHHLETQMGYLDRKPSTLEAIKQAYNIYLMKSELLSKLQHQLSE